MDKYDLVLFIMVMINMIFSFINLIVVDAALSEHEERRKQNDSSEM